MNFIVKNESIFMFWNKIGAPGSKGECIQGPPLASRAGDKGDQGLPGLPGTFVNFRDCFKLWSFLNHYRRTRTSRSSRYVNEF